MEYPTIVRAKDLTKLPFHEKMVVMGLAEWPARTAVGMLLTAATSYVIKRPRAAFNADGTIKQFTPLSANPYQGTYCHFVFAPVIGGLLLGQLF